MERFVLAGPRRYRVQSLSIYMNRDYVGDSDGGDVLIYLATILRLVRGVHASTLWHGRFDSNWLCGSGLKGEAACRSEPVPVQL
jgi:hypothetical protein